MVVISLFTLMGNVTVLVVLDRIRTGDAHMQASWIFTVNDIQANLLVILAAVFVAAFDSVGLDLVIVALIFLIVANGAHRILRIGL